MNTMDNVAPMNVSNMKNLAWFVVYIYGVWIVSLVTERLLDTYFVSTPGSRSMYWILVRLCFWIVPAIWFMRTNGLIDALRIPDWKRLVIWGGGAGALLAGISVAVHGFSHTIMSHTINWEVFSAGLYVPMVEELVFRGAILAYLSRRFDRFWLANAIVSILFVGIHCPGWWYQGVLHERIFSVFGGFLSVLALGAIFGYVMKRSKSVWGGVIAHSLNNLFNFVK